MGARRAGGGGRHGALRVSLRPRRRGRARSRPGGAGRRRPAGGAARSARFAVEIRERALASASARGAGRRGKAGARRPLLRGLAARDAGSGGEAGPALAGVGAGTWQDGGGAVAPGRISRVLHALKLSQRAVPSRCPDRMIAPSRSRLGSSFGAQGSGAAQHRGPETGMFTSKPLSVVLVTVRATGSSGQDTAGMGHGRWRASFSVSFVSKRQTAHADSAQPSTTPARGAAKRRARLAANASGSRASAKRKPSPKRGSGAVTNQKIAPHKATEI